MKSAGWPPAVCVRKIAASGGRFTGRTTAGRSAGSVSSKMTKPADGPMFPRRPADFIFLASAGRPVIGRPTVRSLLKA